MSKRRLSQQQARQIAKHHQDRLANTSEIVPNIETGIGQEQVGLVIANFGGDAEIISDDNRIISCQIRQNLGDLVCGDQIAWQETQNNEGVITAIFPRKSCLSRSNTRGEQKSIAANIDQMLVVIAPNPLYTLIGIDQYLIAAELSSIEPIIICNKRDSISQNEFNKIEKDLAIYQEIGYQLLYCSAKSGDEMSVLDKQLKDKTSVFIGQSGVGKSSLINHFVRDSNVKIGETISKGQGRHTTTTARLYHLDSGGKLIDAPGIREFSLGHIPQEDIFHGFREFQQFQGQCKFRNCQHQQEIACAIRKAVNQKKIHPQRLTNYGRILVHLGLK